MISFVFANARSTPGIAPQAAPAAAPATIITGIRSGRLTGEQERDTRRADRAEVELALGADVEQAHPERDGGREPGERSGVAEIERFGERAVRDERASNRRRYVDHAGGRSRRARRRREQRGRERSERDHDLQPAMQDEPLLDRARPDASSHARHPQAELVDARRPRVRPHRRSALVHDHDAVGEREHLVEVLADQQHRRPRRRRRRGGSRGPSRSPRRRALSSARRRRGPSARPENSRPSTTFCRFPPDRSRAGRPGPASRTS